jgi:hypothetical protein
MPGVDPAIPSSNNPNVRMMERLATLERTVSTLQRQLQGQAVSQIPVVTTLGTAGRIGRIVMLESDQKLYRDTGAAWVLNS